MLVIAKGAPLPSSSHSLVSTRPQAIGYNRCVLSFEFGSKSSTASTSTSKRVWALRNGRHSWIPVKAGATSVEIVDTGSDAYHSVPHSLHPSSSNRDNREANTNADATPDTTGTPAVAPANIASSTVSTGGFSANFQKLKAPKIKVLAKKASLMKQNLRMQQTELPVKDATVDSSINSDSSVRYTAKKKKIEGSVKHEPIMSPTSQTPKFQEPEENVKSSNIKVKSGVSHTQPTDKTMAGKPDSKRTGYDGRLASRFRGWGDGGSRSSFKFGPADPPLRQSKNSAQSDFFSRKSFKDIGCSEFMIESLKRQAFLRPSHIQAMAFVPVIEGKSCILSDQSGSGKTLAYLIPLIQRLRQEELLGHSEPSSPGPQVLIMVPTAELATQVLNNCRSMSKFGVPFRTLVVTGGFRQRTQVENLEQGVDVLIATPGRFMFLINEGFLNLKNLRCAVLDEVDVLFNHEDFEVSLQSLTNSSSLNTQYLFVTATLPTEVYNKLVEAFPDCQVILGPGMHRMNVGLEENLVDCSGKDESEKTPEMAFFNKKSALLQLVEQTPVPKTIIFCNKIEVCRKVENVLKRFDRKGSRTRVLPFHAALPQELRLSNMKEFMNSNSDRGSQFLVCTDRASRGIDFAGVDHVVLFDFPRDPSEYVRRVGRTARGAGGEGKAFIFAVGKQVSLARKIIDRNQKGWPLHDVPFAYELAS